MPSAGCACQRLAAWSTGRVRFPPDPGLVRVLRSFDVRPSAILGHGGEAWVYALDEERVIRVLHEGATAEGIRASAELVDKLARSTPSFSMPQLIDTGAVEGRWYAIERRLRGRPVLDELTRLGATDRAALVEAYLECSSRLGDLALDPAPWWGDLLRDPPLRTDSWRDYLRRKADQSLKAAGPDFVGIEADALADQLPAPAHRSFVHLDAFPGNILASGATIVAVIDFGATTAAGDRRFDPAASAVYLTSEITPTANDRDRAVAQSWLRSAGLVDWFDPVRRWLAAYWSFARGDHRLHAWCRSVLVNA